MNQPDEPKVPTVSCEDVLSAIQTNEPCVLLDVRTPGEYGRGRIPGSVNVPLDRVAEEISTKIPDTEKKVYVYCLSGSRSSYAVDFLLRMGYTNVFDMKQGLLAWRAKYFPVSP